MHEEHNMRERDKYDLLDQRMAQRIDGRFDQLRPIVERNNANSRREAGLEFKDFLLYTVDHLLGVFARAGHHYAADRLRRAFHQRGRSESASDLNRPDVFYVNWRALVRGDDNLADIVQILDQPEPAHDRPGPLSGNPIPAPLLIPPHTCPPHL